MPSVDPTTYSWLSTSILEQAGCITVTGGDPDAVARAFGHQESDLVEESTFAQRADLGDLGDGTEVGVVALAGGAGVFELNGFEGTRSEVLRDASKVGDKIAASLYWSVNGAIRVTCARRGKVTASFELPPYDEDELAEVPRALRKLARVALKDEEVDELAIGAAMLETYTGVGFAPSDLDGSRVLPIVSRPADLRTYTSDRNEFRPLDHQLPGVQDAIEELSAEHQRALAEWAAAAAVREAGLSGDATVGVVLGQYGAGEASVLPPGLEQLKRRADQELDRQRKLVDDDLGEASHGALALHHAALPVAALEALRYTSHADPYSAAVGAVSAAASAYANARVDRGARFAEDERGRRLESFDPPPRSSAFAVVLREVLGADPREWGRMAERLPTPLSTDDLAAAAEADRRWQEAGAFSTWQVQRREGVDWAYEEDEDVSDAERELLRSLEWSNQVQARYEALERVDAAKAARGPIAVEVLDPENVGGFAVQMSDGTRVERLPAGQAVGRLWLTFVFRNEFGIDPWESRHRGRPPARRVAYVGSAGPIPYVGGGGGGDGSTYHWSAQVPVTGLSWVRLDYQDEGRTVASETIELTRPG